jgi:acyl-coenzyme A thioesterase PaaI-like protein
MNDDHRLPTATIEGPGSATARLGRDWWSWTGPHGGALAALLLETAGTIAGADRQPRVLTVQLLATSQSEDLELEASVLRDGGSSSVVGAALTAPGEPTTLAIGTLISARPRDTAGRYDAVPPPVVAGPADLPDTPLPVEFVPFSQHVDFRFATPALPLGGGDTAELVAWLRLKSAGCYGPAALAVLSDAMPPALYAATHEPVPVPTVELSIMFTEAPPAEGWVLVRIASRTAHRGWCVDDCDVWDTDGALLAQSRQTRRVLGDF